MESLERTVLPLPGMGRMGAQAGAAPSGEGMMQSVKVGKLNLVDLAGSERVHITGATGMRATWSVCAALLYTSLHSDGALPRPATEVSFLPPAMCCNAGGVALSCRGRGITLLLTRVLCMSQ